MSFYQEFKTFAMRGNAIDLAVGVVVGAAFTSIVNSLVKDIINPPLGLLTPGGATNLRPDFFGVVACSRNSRNLPCAAMSSTWRSVS